MLVATVAILAVDLSYARSIGKSRASAIVSLPTQRHLRPIEGSSLPTRNLGIKILSQIIRTSHNSRFRRAVLDETPEPPETSSEELPIDAPEPPANFLGTNLPMEGSEEAPVDEYQYRYHGQGDSFALDEDSRRRFIEGEEYAARLPPIESGDSLLSSDSSFGSIPTSFTLDPLIPQPLALNNLIYNLDPPLRTDSGETGKSPQTVVTPVPKDAAVPKDSQLGTKVGPPPTDDFSNGSGATDQGEANTVNSKTEGKPSSKEGGKAEPKTSTGDQKDESNISEAKANAVADAGTGPSKDADKSPDVAVEDVKSDGTPVIIKIYLNQRPGDKGAKEYEIVKTIEQEPSGEEVPTPPIQENKAVAIAETKSQPSSDDESKKWQTKNAHEDVQPVNSEKPTSPTSAQQPSTEPNKEGPTEKPKEKTGKKKTAKKHPSPERMRHGDYVVFRLTGTDQDEKFSTTPRGAGKSQIVKTTLPADVVDLIAWNGDPGKQPPDVSNPNPRLAQAHARARMFRA